MEENKRKKTWLIIILAIVAIIIAALVFHFAFHDNHEAGHEDHSTAKSGMIKCPC